MGVASAGLTIVKNDKKLASVLKLWAVDMPIHMQWTSLFLVFADYLCVNSVSCDSLLWSLLTNNVLEVRPYTGLETLARSPL